MTGKLRLHIAVRFKIRNDLLLGRCCSGFGQEEQEHLHTLPSQYAVGLCWWQWGARGEARNSMTGCPRGEHRVYVSSRQIEPSERLTYGQFREGLQQRDE